MWRSGEPVQPGAGRFIIVAMAELPKERPTELSTELPNDPEPQLLVDDAPGRLVRLLGERAWRSLVDLGCGDGAVVLALEARGLLAGKDLFLVDISPQRLARLGERLGRLGDRGDRPGDSSDPARDPAGGPPSHRATVRCIEADACDVPDLPAGAADVVVSTMVIEHVSDDRRMVAQIARLLSPGGVAYVSTVLKRWYSFYYYRRGGQFVLDPTHVREYRRKGPLLEALAAAGLEVVEERDRGMWFPLTDFLFRRLRRPDAYNRPLWRAMRRLKVPVPGYRNWEIIVRKGS